MATSTAKVNAVPSNTTTADPSASSVPESANITANDRATPTINTVGVHQGLQRSAKRSIVMMYAFPARDWT
jgi:hypothetical protein